ncbi:hypothetical protein HYPSUDRAFT_33093 [Hypholoma sublateritium FD-334 SS-4]|uniref:Uncharacterized protein n=1 Tax=Hypholoma sublateritium (strain FD-334 SS-4) TaxID=945553 RepID=A0A0D2QAU3_HYPSF|nr:hypothetical protein HYPSUDRAFT_33093 [Hypholoma sublateritium FD-334 SS-4]
MPIFCYFQREANSRTARSRTHSIPTPFQLKRSQRPPSDPDTLYGPQLQRTHDSRIPTSTRPRSWHSTYSSNYLRRQGESRPSLREPATRTHGLTASDSFMYTTLLLEASAARDSAAAPATPRQRTTSAPPSFVHRAPPDKKRHQQKSALGTLVEAEELAHDAKDAARTKPLPRVPLTVRKTAARRPHEKEDLVDFGRAVAVGRRYGSLVGASMAIMQGR